MLWAWLAGEIGRAHLSSAMGLPARAKKSSRLETAPNSRNIVNMWLTGPC